MSLRDRIPDGDFWIVGARRPDAAAPGGFAPTEDIWVSARPETGPAYGAPRLNVAGRIVLPGFVDCHAHLDKGHVWPRAPNPDGTFDGALEAVEGDREARWSAADVEARMEFALRCAWAHGTVAVRTHLDSIGKQTAISWPVFRAARDRWAGRIALQGVCLVPIDLVGSDEFVATADEVARSGGVLGAVAFALPDLDARLDAFFALAAERGLDADLHVDETQDPKADALRSVAEAALRNRFEGRVLCGHCCSLANQPDDMAEHTIARVAEAGLSVVSLPLCNLYLQDRRPGKTPRSRGITLVHELKAAGVPVAFASDNTRDPFHAYGDLDMFEVMRTAARVAHLDHPVADWPEAFSAVPARIMGIERSASDLVIVEARDWTELLARPQADRLVIRKGRRIDSRPPPYSELDHLAAAE